MRIYFVLFAGLIFLPKEDGVILTSPQNEAVVSGDRIKLECASDSTNGLQWQFTPFGSTLPLTIITGCGLSPMHNTTYSVEIIDAGSCNIVVLAASVNEVGTYTCVAGFDPQQQAQLVVLDSKPNCTVLLNGGNTTDLVAGENTTMICTVRYSTNLSPPAAKWTDPQDQLGPGLPTGLPMDGNFYSYINIMANRSDIQPYSIMIYFLPPDNTASGAASNAPNYAYNWTSDVIPVLYRPESISIDQNESDCLSDQSNITLVCNASSNPSADYKWIDGNSVNVSSTQNFYLTLSSLESNVTGFVEFTCIANNTIRTIIYNVSLSVNVTICHNGSDESDEGHGLSDAEIAGIVVGCVAAVNLLMTFVFLFIYTKNINDYNATFSFLEKMLPFLNNSKDHLMSKILWTILSILIAVSIGIIILPVIMIKVSFCKKGNKD